MVEYLAKKHEVAEYDFHPENLPLVKDYDWVIHLGAISSTTEKDVNKIILHNYEFSKWLYNQCRAYNVNLQYASSASIYGITNNFQEDAPPQPQSPYAWSKYLFDRWVEGLHTDNLVQGFRYFNVYGPHEDHKGDQASPVHKFTEQAKINKVVKVFENSDNYRRDFVCVKDICQIHERFFKIKESGIFNVGTGEAVSFMYVANKIAKKYKAKVETIPMPKNLKNQYQKYTCADLSKLSTLVKHDFIKVGDYIDGS